MALMAACAPSATALATCSRPPVQSPAANRPGTAVAMPASVRILFPSSCAPQLARKVAAARGAVGDEHAVRGERVARRERDAFDLVRPFDGGDRPGVHRKPVRQAGGRLAAVGQQRDRARDRQQHARFFERVFALPEHGDRLAAVEECVAYRAVAHAAALEFGHARNIRHGARRAGGEDDRVRRVFPGGGLDHKALFRVFDAGRFGLDAPRAQPFGLRAAARKQRSAGDRLREAEVVFDLVGFGERAAARIQHDGV